MKLLWNIPPPCLVLSRGNIHIWRAVLDLPEKKIEDLKKSLSEDEVIRAGRFRYEQDKNRFISARGILRLILADYLSLEPGALRFEYEKEGKPRLRSITGQEDIQFNLSHSEGLALYVFTRGCEAGVDLERIRNFPEMEQIVEQFFSAGERALFGALPSDGKQKPFFNWWTRKEALTKATGKGLSYPLRGIDFPSIDDKSTGSLKKPGYEGKQTKWSIWDVQPTEDYAGAVVVETGNWNVQYWQWSGKTRDYQRKNVE
jgi:4'-phosphopantetheinyl transferase